MILTFGPNHTDRYIIVVQKYKDVLEMNNGTQIRSQRQKMRCTRFGHHANLISVV